MEHTNTIDLDETHRIVVDLDDYYDFADCPAEWVGGGVVSFRKPSRSIDLEYGKESDLDVIETILDHNPEHGAFEAAVQRHFARKGYAATTASLTGNMQGSWQDVVVYVPEADSEYLESTVETVRQWFAGEIYTVGIERLETWTNEHGDERQTWELQGSLGGCYLDPFDEDEVVSTARGLESFPDDEVLPAVFPGEVIV